MENRKTKLIWSISLIVVVVFGLTNSALADLLAHYTFDDGTADDLSAYGHHGTLMGGASIIYDIGQWNKEPNYALRVDNSLRQYVNCGGGNGGWGDIPQETLTIAAWYKPIGWNPNFATIVSKGNGDDYDCGHCGGYSLSRHLRNDNVTFTCMSVGGWEGIESTDPCAWDSQWHHVVGVYVSGMDGPDEWYSSKVEIYVDGILSNSAEKWRVGIPLNELDVIIGGIDEPNYMQCFNGFIDDVRIYDEALDANTIMDICIGNPPNITLTINVEPNDVGIDTITPGIGEYLYSQDQLISLKANDFVDCPDVYRFDRWKGNVANVKSANTTVIMSKDKTVTAVFVDTQECGDQCHPILDGDVNGDCYINFDDFAIYCVQWLSCTHPDCGFVLVLE